MKFSFSRLFSALLLTALPLAAQVPQALNYQGRVAVNGSAFTGTGQFRFALVDGAGAVLWSSHASAATPVSVAAGLYSVRLGDTTLPNMAAVPSALFANADLRLRVWFDDGANGPQQLAPDQRLAPVGYAHRAASVDSVPASAIAPGSIQPSHLAASLQTGTAAGLASLPAAGGALNVTFPQPFETPPAVTLGGLTVPPANVTTTGFSYTVPPRELLVDDGTPPSSSVGAHRDAILVGGFPAIAYTDETSGDLKYVRATNAQGSAWGPPLVAAVGGANIAGSWCSMAVVNGNPAIAYHDATNLDLKFVRANDATGATWGAPVTVASHATNSLGAGCVLRYVIQSVSVRRPVIAYLDATAGTVRFKSGNNSDGTSWAAEQTPAPSLTTLDDGTGFDFDITGGSLTLAYHNPGAGRVEYVTSSSVLGGTWTTPVAFGVADDFSQTAEVDLFPADGGLSCLWESGDLMMVRKIDANGAVEPAYTAGFAVRSSRVVPGDFPATIRQFGSTLGFMECADAPGLNWKAARPIPAAPFYDAQNSTLLYRPGAVRLTDGSVLAVYCSTAGGNGRLMVSGAGGPVSAAWEAVLPSPLIASGVTAGSISRASLDPKFFGDSTRSFGASALAVGAGTSALGFASWASGSGTTASGDNSTAMGYGSAASGDFATAMGIGSTASGSNSTAMGDESTASGIRSTAIGYGTTASGNTSTAMGISTTASGYASTAMGNTSRAETYGEISLGILPRANSGDPEAHVSTDVLFEIGNGDVAASTPSNGLTMLKDGRIGLGTVDTPAEMAFLFTLPNSTTATTGQARANAWTTYSDSRIKTEQRPLAYGLPEIMRLQPRAYTQHSGCVENGTFKCEDATGGSAETIGFIAQEVEQVIPEAVQKPADPANQLYGMDYQKLIPVLVKATQELKAENDTLKSGAAALKTELDATNAALRLLQQRLDRLERPARKR